MIVTATVISLSSVIVSTISVHTVRKLWADTHRPIITARIEGDKSVCSGPIPIMMVIENTGPRPAKNIRYTFDEDELAAALIPNLTGPQELLASRFLNPELVIPVLSNGQSVSGLMGKITEVWKARAVLTVTLTYESIDGRRYSEKMPIVIQDNASFTGLRLRRGNDNGGASIITFPPINAA